MQHDGDSSNLRDHNQPKGSQGHHGVRVIPMAGNLPPLQKALGLTVLILGATHEELTSDPCLLVSRPWSP